MTDFRGILLDKTDAGFSRRLARLDDGALPEGDVTVHVEWSTLNYKDGLALCNKGPVVRKWPMVPGIDGAGTVEVSTHPDWRPGDVFLLNGFGVGETHWGCLAARARLRGDWLIPLPPALSAREAMAIGTAGYTAMLSVMALEAHGIRPDAGEVLVTGASGGVGSVAIALLSGLGYRVAASTGKPEASAYLTALGAASILDRASLGEPGKPLQKERWAAAIDSVGSHTLANVCAQTLYGGIVAACGLAQGMDLPVTVAPFILRGVTLAGIDSVMAPHAKRREAWRRLAQVLDRNKLAAAVTDIGLDDVFDAADALMAGRSTGRTVVKIA